MVPLFAFRYAHSHNSTCRAVCLPSTWRARSLYPPRQRWKNPSVKSGQSTIRQAESCVTFTRWDHSSGITTVTSPPLEPLNQFPPILRGCTMQSMKNGNSIWWNTRMTPTSWWGTNSSKLKMRSKGDIIMTIIGKVIHVMQHVMSVRRTKNNFIWNSNFHFLNLWFDRFFYISE